MTIDLKRLRNLAGAVREHEAKLRKPHMAAKKWYNITSTGEATRIDIYDMIGQDPWTGEGVSAKDFVDELNSIEGAVDIHVNSEGGYVWDGLAIFEAISQFPHPTTGSVDGLAASAASFILMACDTVKVGKRARMMVHDAAVGGGIVMGSAAQIEEHIEDLKELVGQLNDMSDNIADIYAEKAGGTRAEWRSRMSAGKDNGGTWFNAEEAVAVGLADAIIGEEKKDKGPTNSVTTPQWDPNEFANIMKGVFA